MANLDDLEQQFCVLEEKELISERKAKIRSKRTLTGKYYAALLHKEPIKCLLIIGAFLGCIISIYLVVENGIAWWWIPLSIMFIGPIGLVFFALILPFIPWIVYIVLRVLIEIAINS